MSFNIRNIFIISFLFLIAISSSVDARRFSRRPIDTSKVTVSKLPFIGPVPLTVEHPSPPTAFLLDYYDNTDAYTLQVRDKNHLRVDGLTEFLQTIIIGGPVNGVGYIMTSNVSLATPINTLPASTGVNCVLVNFGPFNQPFFDFSNATFDGPVAFGSGSNVTGMQEVLLATCANQYSGVLVKSALGEAVIRLWLTSWGDTPAAFLSQDPRAPGYFNIFNNVQVGTQPASQYDAPPFGVTCASPFGNRVPTKAEMQKLLKDLNVKPKLVHMLFGAL
jgi:hypothetical protein